MTPVHSASSGLTLIDFQSGWRAFVVLNKCVGVLQLNLKSSKSSRTMGRHILLRPQQLRMPSVGSLSMASEQVHSQHHMVAAVGF